MKENIKLIPVASHGNRFEGDAVLAGWSRQVVSNLERTDEDFRLKKMEVSIKSNEHCPFGNGSISEDYICGKRMDPDESPEDVSTVLQIKVVYKMKENVSINKK